MMEPLFQPTFPTFSNVPVTCRRFFGPCVTPRGIILQIQEMCRKVAKRMDSSCSVFCHALHDWQHARFSQQARSTMPLHPPHPNPMCEVAPTMRASSTALWHPNPTQPHLLRSIHHLAIYMTDLRKCLFWPVHSGWSTWCGVVTSDWGQRQPTGMTSVEQTFPPATKPISHSKALALHSMNRKSKAPALRSKEKARRTLCLQNTQSRGTRFALKRKAK